MLISRKRRLYRGNSWTIVIWKIVKRIIRAKEFLVSWRVEQAPKHGDPPYKFGYFSRGTFLLLNRRRRCGKTWQMTSRHPRPIIIDLYPL